MKKKIPRLHHFVPQFYLRSFSFEDQIGVFDTQQRKLFTTNPKNVASERDLYRLEGSQPALAEELFSKIEAILTPIFSKIILEKRLPPDDSDEFVSLLSFIAILVLRHPDRFDAIESFQKSVISKALQMHSQVGVPPESGITPSELKEALMALENGSITIKIPRDLSLGTAMENVRPLTEALMLRSWGLVTAKASTFITTSHPVLLAWDDMRRHERHSPGFELEGTSVYFPISPELLMVGKYAPIKKNAQLYRPMVAALNGLYGVYSPRFLFSRDDSSELQLGKIGTYRFGNLKEAFERLSR